ncbi:hypothetical protein J6590_080094 [Homalodisca vitripennis]|nr:hypothetical protein J6590_080094 [Homalodisca vitripennis]
MLIINNVILTFVIYVIHVYDNKKIKIEIEKRAIFQKQHNTAIYHHSLALLHNTTSTGNIKASASPIPSSQKRAIFQKQHNTATYHYSLALLHKTVKLKPQLQQFRLARSVQYSSSSTIPQSTIILGGAGRASPAAAASAAASASLCASPLLSQSILAKKTYDIACQTEDIHLKSKDELVARVKELTILQSNLVDKIQDLTRQLEETKKKKKTEKYETKKECAETQTNIEVTHIKSTQTEDACTQQSTCKKCEILQDETKKLISTIRTMEDDQIRNSGFPIYPDNLSIKNSYSVLEEEGCGEGRK